MMTYARETNIGMTRSSGELEPAFLRMYFNLSDEDKHIRGQRVVADISKFNPALRNSKVLKVNIGIVQILSMKTQVNKASKLVTLAFFTILQRVTLTAVVSPGRTLRFDGKETTASNRLLFHRACPSTWWLRISNDKTATRTSTENFRESITDSLKNQNKWINKQISQSINQPTKQPTNEANERTNEWLHGPSCPSA